MSLHKFAHTVSSLLLIHPQYSPKMKMRTSQKTKFLHLKRQRRTSMQETFEHQRTKSSSFDAMIEAETLRIQNT